MQQRCSAKAQNRRIRKASNDIKNSITSITAATLRTERVNFFTTADTNHTEHDPDHNSHNLPDTLVARVDESSRSETKLCFFGQNLGKKFNKPHGQMVGSAFQHCCSHLACSQTGESCKQRQATMRRIKVDFFEAPNIHEDMLEETLGWAMWCKGMPNIERRSARA